MRYLLAAALAIAGCRSAPSAPAPSNKAPAPDHTKTAEDVLGFLPSDADIVVGVDMVQLRRSALWAKFEPQITALVKQQMQRMGGACNDDKFLKTIERMTFTAKQRANDVLSLVVVLRGIDPAKINECMLREAKQRGGQATVDRGITITSYPDVPKLTYAAAVVGASTLVVHADDGASYDTVTRVLASGAPLRGSPSFMTLFQRREPNATVWAMANGNAQMFDDMAGMGMRPKSLDGTMTVSDRFSGTLRMTMASSADATRIAAELDKVKGPVGSMVERFETNASGDVASMNVVITEAQLRSLIGLMGGMMGP